MNINFVGRFYNNHSLSIVNRYLAIAMSKAGASIKITALDAYDPEFNLDKQIVKQLKELEQRDFDTVDIELRHSYPPSWAWPKTDNTKIVYIQPWEFGKVPFEWQYKFETFADHLIVPSEFTRKSFLAGGLNPNRVTAIANGYDESIYNTDPSDIDVSKFGIEKDKFNFIFVGNTQWRKNLVNLLQAWSQIFKNYDNARLIVKDNVSVYGNSNILNEILKLQVKTECAPIVYIKDELSDEEMAAIYKSSNVVIHPYRAEGFGMHIQEAVACGCIPIVSDNGPTEEFLPRDVGFRIATKPAAINIQDPNIFATKPGDSMTQMSTHSFVHEPIMQSMIEYMNYVYYTHDKKNLYNKVNNYNNPNTWDNIANKYIKVLSDVNSIEKVIR